MAAKSNSTFRYLLFGLLVALWVYGIYDLAQGEKQWDFKTYYYAAVAHERGLDAYDTGVLEQIAGSPIKLSYVYPPLTLWFFRPFAVFEFKTAYFVYLFLKLVLLIALVLLWRKSLFHGEDNLLFLWFMTLAYASTIYWDLVAGNIGIVEQILFWIAMIALLRRQMLLFTIAIVAISFFKLTFIVFLALPLLWRRKEAMKYAAAGFAAFGGYLLGNYLIAEREFKVFLSVLGVIDERGEEYNHSLLAMIRDLFDKSEAAKYLGDIPAIVPNAIYVAGVVVILMVSWQVIRNRSAKGGENFSLDTIYFACLVYALAMPRMKTYSFILLIPPTYHVIRKCVKPEAFMYLFMILALTKWTPLPVPDFARFLWWYFPWLAALLIWIIFVRHLMQPSSYKVSQPQEKLEY